MAAMNPTRSNIKKVSADLRRAPDTFLVEGALKLLFEAYPKNNRQTEVLLKVTTLNKLYSTNIYRVSDAARHIVGAKLDALINSGDPKAVELIKKMPLGGRERGTYSFATKYCSWHNREAYPIYDGNVRKALRKR